MNQTPNCCTMMDCCLTAGESCCSRLHYTVAAASAATSPSSAAASRSSSVGCACLAFVGHTTDTVVTDGLLHDSSYQCCHFGGSFHNNESGNL